MSDQADFIVLYRELGIGPDSSLDGLRLAYRRRVADLHPDRGSDSGQDVLKSLNHLYAAALDFHRHYGRLPGAPASARTQPRRDRMEPQRSVDDVAQPESGREVRRPPRMVVYGILVLSALLVWWLSRNDAQLPGFPDGVAVEQRKMMPATAMGMQLGMSTQDVVAVIGDPVSRELGGTFWEYGPSWVRFECAEVVDWYSSPLRPLKASRSRPANPAMSAASAGARHCSPVAEASAGSW